jgi:serine protease Do
MRHAAPGAPRRAAAGALALALAASGAPARAAPEPVAAPAGPAEAAVAAARIEAAVEAVRPALVRLTVVARHFSDGRAQRYPSAGSGVIVTAAGELLTNYHVAGRAERIAATLASGEIVDAEVVGHDALTDLSVLRLDLSRRPPGAPPLVPARFRAGEPAVGEPVLALGSPLTLASSVTLGIVSNTRRVFTDITGTRLEEMELEGEPTGLFTLWIQHDALILPGNSGGPLVDLDGRIVGINELGGAGVGFAIPAPLAEGVLAEILARGRVRRADLGWTLLPVAKLGPGRAERGALVASVTPGGAAERAGVRPGDRLLALAGEPVTVRFFEELPDLYRRISELAIGEPVALELARGAETLAVAARPSELEEAAGAEGEARELGIAVQELTAPMAIARQVEPRSGLLVTSVRNGSPAALAKPGVESGDLLTALAGRALRTIADLRAALAAAGRGELLAALRRDDERLLAVVRLENERERRSGGELPKAWLGVRTQVVTPALARAIGAPALRGFRVTQVLPWSEAERAGLETGDVIVALDGQRLEAEREQDADALRQEIQLRGIGETVALEVRREGAARVLGVRLEARPLEPGEARSVKLEALGFAARDLTLFDRAELHLDRAQQGALAIEVVPGGWAQMAGLEPDDLIVSVAGREVADVAGLEAVVAAAMAERPEVLPLFVRRGRKTHFVFLEPKWNGANAEEEVR